ncbi:MAG: AAA family ATPase [Verrucomicrobiia bacterium]|jgi:predicted ATPase
MKLSKEMRLLQSKWVTTTGWPKRIEWLEIEGVRGWTGQRVEFKFPMVVVCGENGSGKSTVLQTAASAYKQKGDQNDWYASDFFPETAWDKLENAELRYSIRQGIEGSFTMALRRATDRWTGYNKRPQRDVQYIDLARIQPISSRVGYSRLAKPSVKEKSASEFDSEMLLRLSSIMGRNYDKGKMAITDADEERAVPVVALGSTDFSAFHQGAGETTVAELLNFPFTKNSLLLIDEIETSLHPRAQRRLVRDLAEKCRALELQIIISTHSPYVLEEFPPDARCYILQSEGGSQRQVVFGVSPEFAMTKMDDESYPECDLYVEDDHAKTMLREILVFHAPDIVARCQIIPYGSANVGHSLGQMAKQKRFPRRSLVFLDGEQQAAEGCIILPGGDAPEIVVFEALKAQRWNLLDMRTGRSYSEIQDACTRAMTIPDHHEWVNSAARDLLLGGDTLWQIMASTWAGNCLTAHEAESIAKPIRVLLS